MITTTYKKSHTLLDTHTGNLAMVWESKRYPPAVRTLEGNRSFHRTIRNSAFSRQNSSVCQKSSQPLFLQMFADILLILGQLNCLLKSIVINFCIKQCTIHCLRNKIKQHFDQLSGIDRTSVGRKTGFKTDRHTTIPVNLAGSSFQHLLATVGDR